MSVLALLWLLCAAPAWSADPHLEYLAGSAIRPRAEGSPTLLAGPVELLGRLRHDGRRYFIDTASGPVPALFAEGKPINGYAFDQISREHFTGLAVRAQGAPGPEGFLIKALLPDGLFSASPEGRTKKLRPESFTRKTLMKASLNKKHQALRYVYWDQGPTVRPGDTALLLTLSGRQGDSNGTAAGHLAAGEAVVRDDLSLDAEIFNVYYPNDKGIKSANTDIVDYYGSLSHGQNQFRPTITAVLYGFDPARLKALRRAADDYHLHMRQDRPDYGLRNNCTTATTELLDGVDVYAAARRKLSLRDFHKLQAALTSWLPYAGDFTHLQAYPLSQFLPRPAFFAILENLKALNARHKLGIERVDIIYFGQIPSARPMGGAAIDELKELRFMISPDLKALERID